LTSLLTMRHGVCCLLFPVVAGVLPRRAAAAANEEEKCRVVPLGASFSQAEAPTEASPLDDLKLFPRDVSRVTYLLSQSDDEYHGGGVAVGPRAVRVERSSGECLRFTYDVTDTNECETEDPAWRHSCDASAECANTEGSYECRCPETHWGGNRKKSPCYGHVDTTECCRSACDVEKCKAEFRCVADACEEAVCPRHSTCVPKPPPNSGDLMVLRGGYDCVCDEGFLMEEGRCVERDWCDAHECPCGCRCVARPPRGYACEPEPGFVLQGGTPPADPRRLDSGGTCVALLDLKGPNPLFLKQGDDYVEFGVVAAVAEALTIAFPDGPLGPCLADLGEFRVTYDVPGTTLGKKKLFLEDDDDDDDEPSTSRTKATRRVVVGDVDECSYEGACPSFVHDCIARCRNTIGSYECACPEGYVGDGRRGGAGCVDAKPPIVRCRGAGCEPKVFRSADVRGLMSRDRTFVDVRSSDPDGARRRLRQIFEDGRGPGDDPFCADDSRPCFEAFDDVAVMVDDDDDDRATFAWTRVDLTSNVTALRLEEFDDGATRGMTQLRFDVVYAVADARGNVATATRELVVDIVTSGLVFQLAGVVAVFSKTATRLFLAACLLAVVVLSFAFRRAAVAVPILLLYVTLPTSWIAPLVGRKLFLRVVDLYLRLTRLGLMDHHERLAVAFGEWARLADDQR